MLLEKVKNTVKKYRLLDKNDKVVVAVSGGPDSVALLYLLNGLKKELNLTLHVAHLDHMLRKDSHKDAEFVSNLASKLKIPITTAQVNIKELAKKGSLEGVIKSLATHVEQVSGIPLLVAQVDLHGEELRVFADELSGKIPSGILVLAATTGESCQLLVRVSDDFVGKGIKANEIIQAIAPLIGGTGGGKSNSAQAGGKTPEGIPLALAKAKDFVCALKV